jgi:hypothetical protein
MLSTSQSARFPQAAAFVLVERHVATLKICRLLAFSARSNLEHTVVIFPLFFRRHLLGKPPVLGNFLLLNPVKVARPPDTDAPFSLHPSTL